jgi:hypothetical protein
MSKRVFWGRVAANGERALFQMFRVARFFLTQYTKLSQHYQMAVAYYMYINDHKIYQHFRSEALQNLPKVGFFI